MATKSFIKTIGSKGLLADYNTEGKKLQTELTSGTYGIDISGNAATASAAASGSTLETAINAKQNSLTAGDNITIDGNTISSNQVFVATYGTTSYADMKAAYDAGKTCIVIRDSRYYYLVYIEKTYMKFISPSGYNTIYSVTLFTSDSWSNSVITLQSKLTFDTVPTPGSNNPVTSDGIKTALDSRIPSPTSTTGTQVLKCIDGVIQWVTE